MTTRKKIMTAPPTGSVAEQNAEWDKVAEAVSVIGGGLFVSPRNEPVVWTAAPAAPGVYLHLGDGGVRLVAVYQADLVSQFFARCGLWYLQAPLP